MDQSHPHPPATPLGSTRREFVGRGLAAVGAGWPLARLAAVAGDSIASVAWSREPSRPGADPAHDPIRVLRDGDLGAIETIGGLPFRSQWLGDWFGPANLPFHTDPTIGTAGSPDEEIDVAIVGGGLSGLACAALLARAGRAAGTALFDLRDRLGGNAMGESWRGRRYSLGSAYFMVPDPDTFEDSLYRELGVYSESRIDSGDGFRLEFGGRIVDDPLAGATRDEREAFARYRSAVTDFATRHYPDIPVLPRSRDLVDRLDQRSFRTSVLEHSGGELPPLVARSLQAYCFSSFGIGWEELNAAAGWNFIAAEEFGRIILPGGNAGLARLLWRRFAGKPAGPHLGAAGPEPRFGKVRCGARVVDLRPQGDGVRLLWIDASGRRRVTQARRAIVCGAKHVTRHFMPTLEDLDPDKVEAFHATPTVAYVVANVLLNRPAGQRFYDLFTIHDDAFPESGDACENDRRITDAVAGTFAQPPAADADVLTLYWPLPWHTARFTIVGDEDWRASAAIAAPQVTRLLEALGLAARDVRQVRLARWGHAMPFMTPGFLGSGLAEAIRRPVAGRIHFANQDNWLLPAWETCLAEARDAVDAVIRG